MFTGQSKLKMLVANIALQCVKAIDALNTNNQNKLNCDIGMLKFLMILNLVMVILIILVKIKKSRLFQGQFFSNMVKIKLFLADTESYVPLELNKLAGNVYLFKLTGELSWDNVTLKKNWIWDVLEVNWNNVHISLNDKEVNLPRTLIILLAYKLKVRKPFNERSSLHVYIMLKQRKLWYILENDWD